MLLDRCCSIPVPSVFSPTQELVARLPGMNHGVLSSCTPYSWLLTDRHLPPLLPHGNIHQKKKKCTIPLKSGLWPPVNLPHPSSPLSCLRSSSPLLLPAPSPHCSSSVPGAAQSVSGLKCFHAAQVPGSRTEPFPLEPWWCSSGSHGLPWCRHFPG